MSAVKIAISLPEEAYRRIEDLRRREKKSRSRFFLDAAQERLRRAEEERLERAYVKGYLRYPEDDTEGQVGALLAAENLPKERW